MSTSAAARRTLLQRIAARIGLRSDDNLVQLLGIVEQRSRTLEQQLRQQDELLRYTEARTRTLEAQLHDALALLRVLEERSRSQQYHTLQVQYRQDFALHLLQEWYTQGAPSKERLADTPAVATVRAWRLESDSPIAIDSHDHLQPDSTIEGIARPSAFVAHCMRVVGPAGPWLDIGSGAGGLVFEAVMRGVPAIGLDGSDHCRTHGIGFWPLLPHNLRTCDVTRPFRFVAEGSSEAVQFELVTAWEVLEHIPEDSVSGLLRNVAAQLRPDGYFVGSVSLLEYRASDGTPYHVTLRPCAWWQSRFAAAGLRMLDAHPFDLRLFPRGNGPRFQDMHNYHDAPGEGFHFVASRSLAPAA